MTVEIILNNRRYGRLHLVGPSDVSDLGRPMGHDKKQKYGGIGVAVGQSAI